MRIVFFDIQNFRKLRCVRIELSEKQTIFVGANNSGKTSAMHALDKFLKQQKERKDVVDDDEGEEKNRWFSVEDFTLSLWDKINAIGVNWEILNPEQDAAPELSLSEWDDFLPSLDVWLEVQSDEYHYVHKLIPTLDWDGGLLGIRLRLEPKNDLSSFFSDYRKARKRAQNNLAKAIILNNSEGTASTSNAQEYMQRAFWPKNMKDFLGRRLPNYFAVRYYELDPKKLNGEENWEKPQPLPEFSFPHSGDPFDGIIKIDAVNAQRGFEDADSSKTQRLASQFYDYFRTHLNPEQNPDPKDSDIKAILAISSSEQLFDSTLKASFKGPIDELANLGYPGAFSPNIQVRTRVQRKDVLNHAAAVQYSLTEATTCPSERYLPETYNGLGYQNLISMIFKLMRFRDNWMRGTKEAASSQRHGNSPEPIHLVFVEEPEAHLHAQVQQVFIRKGHSVLRKHENLGENKRFTTQLIVSTHSSHIAHECEFADIRYFQRVPATTSDDVPHAKVVNLSTVFANHARTEEQQNQETAQEALDKTKRRSTQKFVARYLQTTHCDLFFADAAIFIEGSGERMLLPHFLKNFGDGELSCCYISLLEIGGSHAFRLKDLIEHIGLITLIITDIDSVKLNPATRRWTACPVSGEAGTKTANNTLKFWIPRKELITDLLALPDAEKENKSDSIGASVRVAYQKAIPVMLDGKAESICPRTFEDALILSNLELFESCGENDESPQFLYLKNKLLTAETHAALHQNLFDLITEDNSFKKAEFALETLFNIDLNCLQTPEYIAEGLEWLRQQLTTKLPNLQISAAVVLESESSQVEEVK